jgi:hypothetical protein
VTAAPGWWAINERVEKEILGKTALYWEYTTTVHGHKQRGESLKDFLIFFTLLSTLRISTFENLSLETRLEHDEYEDSSFTTTEEGRRRRRRRRI